MAMRFGTRVTVAAMWLLGSLSIMGVAHAASQYPDPSKCSTSPPALVNTGTDPAFPGLWGNPQRIGTGWDIFFNGTQSQAIVYWYTYNAARQPVWLFAGPTNVTADSKGVLQINAPLQQITLVPGSNPVQQSSNVGQVWISFVPGSTTAAAVIWQWNAAGASPQSQECIYNFMHGPQAPSKPVTGNAGGTPLDESYTGNWYNSSQSGWALNISVGIEPDGTNWEVDTAAIYDTAGNPVWLENSQQSPTTQQTTIPLGYYTSNYPGGFPTSDCSTTSCRTATSNANTFVTRSFVNSSQGSAVVSANISAMPKVLWPNTPWYITDPSGDLSLVSIGKISEQNFVAVNQTSCTIPNGQSTCSVVVSWVSASSTGLVYRRNLTDSVLSTTPIGNGNAGSTTDYLGPGADVQYEMHDGSPTGTLLYTSAEVIVPAAQGTTTPVSATPVVAAIPATDTTSDQVGATLAQFRVDESGNATYSIPIQVVPGTAGMTPKVALTYNSRLPNGVMGPGWTIDGASQITRCRQMRESGDFVGATEANGNPLPVNFTQTDRFCLDGVRLLLTSSGTYGASNTTYSPENDPSMRVTATGGTSATGPSNFTVQRKDGTISSYGNTTASPNAVITATLPATGSSVNVAWNLSRVQDSTGNYIDYVYNVQPATQGSPILPYATGAVEYTLSKINYTGHGTTAPYASIIFSYGTISANTRLGYQAGIAFLQSQQLWSVTVQDNAAPGGSQVVRYYDLKDGYAASPSGSGLQVLSKIRECRDSTMTVCYPWTTFTWSQANYALTSAATTTQTGPDFTKLVAYKLADVDGDGRTDVVFAVDSDSHCPNGSAIYVGFSDINSSGQSYLNLAGQTPTCAAFSLKTYDLAWYLVDLDGDGRADLLMGGDGSVGGTWKKYISAGRPASGQPVFATGADFSPVIAIPSTMKAVGLLADVNGDGLPDLIVPDATNPGQISSALGGQLANAGLSVYLMTRQGGALTFAPPYEMVLSFKSTDEICAVSLNVKCTLTFWNTAVSNGSISANDVDGDGRADLTFMLQQTPCTPTTCPNHSVDASNVPIISFNPALGTPNQTTSSQTNYYWMQFTAAGVQPPSVTGMSSNVQLMQEYAFFSTTTFPQLPNLLTNVYAVDLTGDGLSDLLFQDAQDSTQYCFMINLGYGYENPVCQPLPNYQVIGTASNSNLLFADVNGDGKLDVVYPSNLAGNIYGYITLLPSTTTTWAWPSAATAVPGSIANIDTTWLPVMADIDGDGVPDFIKLNAVATSSNVYISRIAGGTSCTAATNSASCSRYHAHEVIRAFTNGLGAVTNVTYQPLTDNGIYQRGPNGTPAIPNVTWGYGSPVFDVVGPIYVVSGASSSAPTKGSATALSTVYYRYEGARMQSGGRGFLGFDAIWTFDGNDEGTQSKFVSTTTTYNQSYPFIGMPNSTTKLVVNGNVSSGAAAFDLCGYNQDTTSYNCFTPVGGATWPALSGVAVDTSYNRVACLGAGCATPSASICSSPSTPVVQQGDLSGAFSAPTTPSPIFAFTQVTSDTQRDLATGSATATTANFFCYDSTSAATYTNLLNSTTVTLDGSNNVFAQKSTSNTYGQDNATYWYLGRLTQSLVTFSRPSASPAGSITRQTNFTYDVGTTSNTGLLLSERIQQGASADQDMRTAYTLDAYGNRTGAYQCSSDIAVAQGDVADRNCTQLSGFVNQQSAGTHVFRYAKTTYNTDAADAGRYITTSVLPFSSGTSVSEAAAVTVNARDSLGNITQQTSANGLVQYAEFGTLGRPYFTSDNTGKASTTTFRLCTPVSCPSDAVFRSQTVTVGAPSSWTYFDVLGRPILQVTQTFDANPSTQAYSAVCSYYDTHNRPAYKSEPFFLGATIGGDGSPSLTSTTPPCTSTRPNTSTSYDILGRVTAITDPDGGIVQKKYSGLQTTTSNPRNATWVVTEIRNPLGEIVSTQDPLDPNDNATTPTFSALLVTQQYDAAGDLTSVTRDAGNGAITTTISYNGNSLGRKTSITDPDAGTTQYYYTPAGEVYQQSDANGQIVTQSYDAMGRRYKRTTSGGTGNAITDVWTYDASSGSCASSRSCGQAIAESRTQTGSPTFSRSFLFDSFGRLYERVTSIAGHSYQEITAFDSHGRLLAQQDATGYSTFPEYSPNGFVGKQQDTRVGAVYQLLGTDARGNPTAEERGGSTSLLTSLAYNANTGRISTICSGTSCGLQNLAYQFDTAGNLTQRTRLASTTPTIEVFTNDALNRLTQAKLTEINGVIQTTPPVTASLAYDKLGNICTKNGTTFSYGGLAGCANHGGASGKPHAVTGAGSATYQYDSGGNQLNGGGRTLVYNALNQLTSASTSSVTTTFLYTPDGDRFQRTDLVGGTTTTTYYVGNVEFLSVGGSATETHRYLAGVAIDYLRYGSGSQNETRYTFGDHLGSLDVVASATGSVIETVSYDALGNLRNASTWNGAAAAPTSTKDGYTGHEEAYSLNLVHMNGRVYDPTLGRMLQADPLTGPGNQSLNRYSYVVNNPLSLTDPTGYSWWSNALRDIAAVAITICTGGIGAELWANAFYADAVLTVGAGGFAAGAIQSGNVRGGLYGAFSAELFFGIGQYFDNAGWAHSNGDIGATNLNVPGYTAKIIAHGIAGGVMSSLEGGKFGHGFLSAGVAEAAAPGIDSLDSAHPLGQYVSAERVIAASIVGGTTSVISGGKFGNGAITAAFGRAFNEEAAKKWSRQNAQQRYDDAKAILATRTDAILFPQFSTRDEAFDWIAGLTSDISQQYGVEIGANIFYRDGAYVLRDLSLGRYFRADGVGGSVNIPDGSQTPGYIGYFHTHPIYVPWAASNGEFSDLDIQTAIIRGGDAYVSFPGGWSHFSYMTYIRTYSIPASIATTSAHGW